MRANKALLLSNMLSSSESIENAEIATFDTSCVSTPDISVDLEPIQDLHGYSNPWPAGGGKNLLNPDTFTSRNSYYTINSNGTMTVTADDTSGWSAIPVMPLKAGTYVFSQKTVTGKCYIRTSDDNYGTNKVIVSSVTSASFTLAQDGGIKLRLGAEAGSYPFTQEYQIETGSTATSWSPYSNLCPISGRSAVNVYLEETYDAQATPKATIQLGQTVYGGTVDVTSGKLTITDAMVDLGTLSWNFESRVFYAYISSMKRNCENALCSCYPFVGSQSWSYMVSNMEQKHFATSKNTGAYVGIKDSSYNTTEEFTTAMSGVQLVYELATPVVVTLTPQQIQTLVGENNVWSDSGNISVRNITCNADFLSTYLLMKGVNL